MFFVIHSYQSYGQFGECRIYARNFCVECCRTLEQTKGIFHPEEDIFNIVRNGLKLLQSCELNAPTSRLLCAEIMKHATANEPRKIFEKLKGFQDPDDNGNVFAWGENDRFSWHSSRSSEKTKQKNLAQSDAAKSPSEPLGPIKISTHLDPWLMKIRCFNDGDLMEKEDFPEYMSGLQNVFGLDSQELLVLFKKAKEIEEKRNLLESVKASGALSPGQEQNLKMLSTEAESVSLKINNELETIGEKIHDLKLKTHEIHKIKKIPEKESFEKNYTKEQQSLFKKIVAYNLQWAEKMKPREQTQRAAILADNEVHLQRYKNDFYFLLENWPAVLDDSASNRFSSFKIPPFRKEVVHQHFQDQMLQAHSQVEAGCLNQISIMQHARKKMNSLSAPTGRSDASPLDLEKIPALEVVNSQNFANFRDVIQKRKKQISDYSQKMTQFQMSVSNPTPEEMGRTEQLFPENFSNDRDCVQLRRRLADMESFQFMPKLKALLETNLRFSETKLLALQKEIEPLCVLFVDFKNIVGSDVLLKNEKTRENLEQFFQRNPNLDNFQLPTSPIEIQPASGGQHNAG